MTQAKSHSVQKHASIASIAVAASRVLGLVREMIFAFFFGASAVFDAYVAAFRIPNLLRDLFAEGALSTAFVSVFSKKLTTEGDESAYKLANRLFTFISVVLGIVVVLGIIFSPTIVHFVASGFEGDKFNLTVTLNRILFPFILFVSLAAICMGMLNAKGKFALPQSASTFFNITSIIVGLIFAYWFAPQYISATFKSFFSHEARPQFDIIETTRAIMGMTIGTLVGGLVQWLIQMPSLLKLGFTPKLIFDFKNPDLIHVLKLTGPAIIGGAAVQINVLINSNFASYLADGSMSWLQYAFRLMQFPIGVFGVAIASATLPALARLKAKNDPEALKETLRNSSRLVLFLCLPSALGLMMLAQPIMSLIYEHGHFTSTDSIQAAHALQAYSIGLVAYSLIKVYQPAFLVFDDSKTPMIISLVSIAMNAGLNSLFVFVFHLSHWGLALGTSIVALFNGILLIFLIRKKTGTLLTKQFYNESSKIIIAAIAACGAGFGIYLLIAEKLESLHFLGRLVTVFAPIGVTGIIYFILCTKLEIKETLLILREFKK